MGQNLTLESLNFGRIRNGDARATADAVYAIWLYLNNEAKDRRIGVRAAIDRLEPKILAAGPTTNQNNYDTKDSTSLVFIGASGINLTGMRARVEGTIVFVDVLGSGTVTVKDSSASSEPLNRILTASGGDLAIATNHMAMFKYLNQRWREMKWA